jgi:hypothetical protein
MSTSICFPCSSQQSLRIPSCTTLCLRAAPQQAIASGVNWAWLFHGATLTFPCACCGDISRGSAVHLAVQGILNSGTVTARTQGTMTLTLTSLFGVDYTIVLSGIRGNACSATTSVTGTAFKYRISRILKPPQCNACTPPLLDVRWVQSGTASTQVFPIVVNGAHEYYNLNSIDTYYVTRGDDPNHTLRLYLSNDTSAGNVKFLTSDDPRLTLTRLEDGITVQQNADFVHDSNILPVSSEDWLRFPDFAHTVDNDSAAARSPVTLSVESTSVPVGYFTFGNGRRLNITQGTAIAGLSDLAPQNAYASFTEGAGTLVQQRTYAYLRPVFQTMGWLSPSPQTTIRFAVELGGIPYSIAVTPTFGVIVAHTSAGIVTFAEPPPQLLEGDNDVTLQTLFGAVALPPVTGSPLSFDTTYVLNKTNSIYTLKYNQTDIVIFTTGTPSAGFLFVYKTSTSHMLSQSADAHAGEQIVLERNADHYLQRLTTVDIAPSTFNDKTTTHFQVYGDNGSIVVGKHV